ncbi:hypothetical protein A3K73_07660 [Candidatus Pacearchaeota archaeon RBG_13_36_9]|nr:MAG: hypothetical protein A3K73_07660 [Candidatus Pacearchaeota archaeon RBG_13_36_9]
MKIVDLPLHGGSCPRWLYPRMEKLAEQIFIILDMEYKDKEILERLSDPLWFQALACALGFDWHSSGTTTTTTAAVKEALQKINIGIYGAGGKGKTSRKTLDDIKSNAEKINISEKQTQKMLRSSKLAAKVDTSALQDGFSLYHHTFFFSKNSWAVIQQGMQQSSPFARRYHWNDTENFLSEPHKAVCCDQIVNPLNMVAKDGREARKASIDVAEDFSHYFYLIKKEDKGQTTLFDFDKNNKVIKFRQEHFPKIPLSHQNLQTLKQISEYKPESYEELLLFKGAGPKIIRSLALVSELAFGTELSWKDPVKFSFAHGGKDGFPYFVDTKQYDESIETLAQAVKSAKLKEKDKFFALKRLRRFAS